MYYCYLSLFFKNQGAIYPLFLKGIHLERATGPSSPCAFSRAVHKDVIYQDTVGYTVAPKAQLLFLEPQIQGISHFCLPLAISSKWTT